MLGPTAVHNIWTGFTEDCANGDGGDVNVLYDKARLMFRNAYRNLSGTEYLVVNHSVAAGGSVGVRWYQKLLSSNIEQAIVLATGEEGIPPQMPEGVRFLGLTKRNTGEQLLTSAVA